MTGVKSQLIQTQGNAFWLGDEVKRLALLAAGKKCSYVVIEGNIDGEDGEEVSQ